MASIAPAGKPDTRQSVSPLVKLGAVLIALLVTVSGVSPLFQGDDGKRSISSGAGRQISTPAAGAVDEQTAPARETQAAAAMEAASPAGNGAEAAPAAGQAPADEAPAT